MSGDNHNLELEATTMKIITNRHRQTGLLFKQGTKLKHCVLMDSSGLTIHRFTEEEFRADDWHEIAGDWKKAVAQFLSAGQRFGITDNARHSLEALA